MELKETEKIRQKGANGLKTETYITKMLNGKVISTTLLSKDTYDAMAKIIVKGAKKEEESIPSTPPEVTTTPPITTEEPPSSSPLENTSPDSTITPPDSTQTEPTNN